MDTLSRIDKLLKSLKTRATEQERDEWWSDFTSIKYDLEQDKRANKYERDTVYNAERSLSQFTQQVRENLPSPNRSSVLVHLGALRTSIAKRTTGVDGWPVGR